MHPPLPLSDIRACLDVAQYEGVERAHVFHLIEQGVQGRMVVALVLASHNEAAEPVRHLVAEVRSGLTEAMKKANIAAAVPGIWIIVRELLLDTAGNVDEQALLRSARMTPAPMSFGNATDSVEDRLRIIVGEILQLPPDRVVSSTSFAQLGGEAASAKKVAERCLTNDIILSTSEILGCKDLAELASTAAVVIGSADRPETPMSTSTPTSTLMQPFGLIAADMQDQLVLEIQSACNLAPGASVEDGFPCTASQRDSMAQEIARQSSTGQVLKNVYRISQDVDVVRFRLAWENTVQACSSLRTRIVVVQGAAPMHLQAVIREEQISWDWSECHDLSSVLAAAEAVKLTYGSRLSRHAIARGADGHLYFVWVMYHFIHDTWTIGLVLGAAPILSGPTSFSAPTALDIPEIHS